MTPILTATEALALFGAAAIGIDLVLRALDWWRARRVIATGSTPSLAAQCVSGRGA